jgi:hypothetical protein
MLGTKNKPIDDMTQGSSYSIMHRDAEAPWQLYFAVAAGPWHMGNYDSEEEAHAAIRKSIEGACEFAKEEEARRQREAEARVEAARQQIPAAYRGLTLDDLSEAGRGLVATFEDRPPSGKPIVHGDADASMVKVACAILVELARQGYSVSYTTITGVLNTRLSDLTSPDFLLVHWPGRVESKIAAVVSELLKVRSEKVTMIVAEGSREQ